jgi:hypothetical protein
MQQRAHAQKRNAGVIPAAGDPAGLCAGLKHAKDSDMRSGFIARTLHNSGGNFHAAFF